MKLYECQSAKELKYEKNPPSTDSSSPGEKKTPKLSAIKILQETLQKINNL